MRVREYLLSSVELSGAWALMDGFRGAWWYSVAIAFPLSSLESLLAIVEFMSVVSGNW